LSSAKKKVTCSPKNTYLNLFYNLTSRKLILAQINEILKNFKNFVEKKEFPPPAIVFAKEGFENGKHKNLCRIHVTWHTFKNVAEPVIYKYR